MCFKCMRIGLTGGGDIWLLPLSRNNRYVSSPLTKQGFILSGSRACNLAQPAAIASPATCIWSTAVQQACARAPPAALKGDPVPVQGFMQRCHCVAVNLREPVGNRLITVCDLFLTIWSLLFVFVWVLKLKSVRIPILY